MALVIRSLIIENLNKSYLSRKTVSIIFWKLSFKNWTIRAEADLHGKVGETQPRLECWNVNTTPTMQEHALKSHLFFEGFTKPAEPQQKHEARFKDAVVALRNPLGFGKAEAVSHAGFTGYV